MLRHQSPQGRHSQKNAVIKVRPPKRSHRSQVAPERPQLVDKLILLAYFPPLVGARIRARLPHRVVELPFFQCQLRGDRFLKDVKERVPRDTVGVDPH